MLVIYNNKECSLINCLKVLNYDKNTEKVEVGLELEHVDHYFFEESIINFSGCTKFTNIS